MANILHSLILDADVFNARLAQELITKTDFDAKL